MPPEISVWAFPGHESTHSSFASTTHTGSPGELTKMQIPVLEVWVGAETLKF